MKWQAALLSLQVALAATILLTVTGLGLAIWLTRSRFRGKVIVETLVNLPLVLPPSVIGYYLLLVLGRGGPLVDWFGWRILFTWPAAVVASALMGLPLMVGASRAALSNVDPALENAGRVLGSTEPEILWRVTLPLARRGILAGVLLGSARALGEFGATLMVAGNIPGRTQTLPLAIYDAVQNQDYVSANRMVLLMTILAFMTLLAVRFFERPARPHAAHWEREAGHE
jgi:molybdate transport system permease protein